jgi:type II secretory pathway pseudopilin PulG
MADMLADSQNRGPLGGRNLRAVGARHGADCKGFSLLELMASIAILIVILGGIFSLLASSQQTYAKTQLKTDMYEDVRGVAELMAQEIGQAGLVTLPAGTTVSSAASAGATTLQVSSTTSMFVGEQLLVGGTTEETVTISAIGSSLTLSSGLASAHAVGDSVTVLGVFPSGIVPQTGNDVYPTGGALPNTPSGGNLLNLFGDINGDGSLVYVRYTCTNGTYSAPGTLTRSVTTMTPGGTTLQTSQTLLSTLVSTPTCFQYVTQTISSNYYVTNVSFTVTVQSRTRDPQNLNLTDPQAYMPMTKSFLNLSPRNIVAAAELANAGITTRLQATPANVSAY